MALPLTHGLVSCGIQKLRPKLIALHTRKSTLGKGMIATCCVISAHSERRSEWCYPRYLYPAGRNVQQVPGSPRYAVECGNWGQRTWLGLFAIRQFCMS